MSRIAITLLVLLCTVSSFAQDRERGERRERERSFDQREFEQEMEEKIQDLIFRIEEEIDVDAIADEVHRGIKDLEFDMKDFEKEFRSIHLDMKDLHIDLNDVHVEIDNAIREIENLDLDIPELRTEDFRISEGEWKLPKPKE